ncbi:MAG: riboflavin biosynthesis protein RibF [Gammaproteobacteria bacterium 28-57-27]|nr:MAG: riboflavin biosynthesis protein RibF [Gammaproteobacteria bacterium 28-57-27]
MELRHGAKTVELRRGWLRAKRDAALSIGNFDGLHLGHQALLQRLDTLAKPGDLEPNFERVVLSFEPLPREVFTPANAAPIPRLSSLREKLAVLAASRQVDVLHLLRFNRALAGLEAEDFVRHVLCATLRVRQLVVGDDFRFGRGRRGDVALLEQMGRALGFAVHTVAPVEVEGARVSSTRVRAALCAGALAEAGRLLGRPYALCARVAHGDKRGRELGFPTLNLPLGRKHFALHGVYAVEVRGLEDGVLYGVANAGVRPTVGGVVPRVEAHVFDWAGDAYGKQVEVRFCAFLRAEQRFAGLDELMAQIAVDAQQARAFFGQS